MEVLIPARSGVYIGDVPGMRDIQGDVPRESFRDFVESVMRVGIDFERLDLRSTLDLAIGLEENEQLQYEEFAMLVDDAAVASFFREMTERERHHRNHLLARRDVLFRHALPRFDSTLTAEPPDPDDAERLSAGAALDLALSNELKAFEFYSAAIAHVKDVDVRASLEECQRQAAEHHGAVRRRLEEVRDGRLL